MWILLSGFSVSFCSYYLFYADYGKSFSDVVQGLEHILENLGADHLSAPSSFKYRVALQKQVKLLDHMFLGSLVACHKFFHLVMFGRYKEDIEIGIWSKWNSDVD